MRKIEKRRGRLIYVPGLLSLLFSPLLFAWYWQFERPLNRPNAIEIFLPPLEQSELEKTLFGAKIYQPPIRNYLPINLVGDDTKDKIKLDFAQLAVADLLASGDTINGVKLNFGKSTKYWTLVRALDIMEIEDVPIYLMKGDNLWVYNYVEKPVSLKAGIEIIQGPPPPVLVCGTASLVPKEEEEDVALNFIKPRLKTAIPALLLFTTLAILSLIRTNRQALTG